MDCLAYGGLTAHGCTKEIYNVHVVIKAYEFIEILMETEVKIEIESVSINLSQLIIGHYSKLMEVNKFAVTRLSTGMMK